MKLNLEADVQSEYSATDVHGGIDSLKMMFKVGKHALPVRLRIMTKTSKTRGVHMSRLVEAAARNSEDGHLEDSLRRIVSDVESSQADASVGCSLEYPFRDIFVRVRVELHRNRYAYSLSVPGITACPCSKEITGVGHMQRAWLTVELMSRDYVDIEEMAVRMLGCFSAATTEMMKRSDEAMKIIEAQENPRFVEDVAREAYPDTEDGRVRRRRHRVSRSPSGACRPRPRTPRSPGTPRPPRCSARRAGRCNPEAASVARRTRPRSPPRRPLTGP
ncbi:MAG: GTP cyclohydrolase I FolE2, partial [Nitrososphaerota archaeon]|nr:GTP cyclohydrolase I FolE2 [Nitrososphaerota archaeon]